MYYIIETQYVGPNQHQDGYTDVNKIEISTRPAINNCSLEPQIYGWCGTNNDWAVFSHGEYSTIEEARTAIGEIFNEVREGEPNSDFFEGQYAHVFETYKPGRYIPMSGEEAHRWVYEEMQTYIEAETTDERIAELLAELEAEANTQGLTLGGLPESDMLDYREELRAELKA